jgi:uroporphyrinogen decarboxylase
VLAQGTPEDVKRAVAKMLDALEDKSRIIVSCGGGMPPDVPSANIEAMISSVEELTR